MDPRAWIALRQRLRRAPRGSAASGSQGLADLLRPALAADLLSAPLCEELLRTARVLRSEGASGASLALASALEGAVSSLALDPRPAWQLTCGSARAWLHARAGCARMRLSYAGAGRRLRTPTRYRMHVQYRFGTCRVPSRLETGTRYMY